MAYNIFGFTFGNKKDEVTSQLPPSPVQPSDLEDGSYAIASGGLFGTYLDIDGITNSTENELIMKYRELALMPDVDSVIDDIVNDAISYSDNDKCLDLNTDQLENLPIAIRKKIRTEFEQVLKMLDFSVNGADIFKRFYVDGRQYYHAIIDPKKPANGIAELRYIDSLDIKLVKEVVKAKDPNTGVDTIIGFNEFYIYTPNTAKSKSKSNSANTTGNSTVGKQSIKLTKDSVVAATSGLVDMNTAKVLSYLHKAIRPANQLRMMEDALVIYRITRAPERRVFYIDVGNLSRSKAEEYVRSLMNRFRNKITYDATTGEVKNDKRHMSMLEDFWLPRQNGKGTEITTLQGGQNLSQMEDVNYFQQKLYQSLNVPLSRMQSQSGFTIGKSTEISRDEVKFNKFINKLRRRFNNLLLETLRIQLILKGIIKPEDWSDIKESLFIDYKSDNHFTELLDQEIYKERANTLNMLQPYIGTYYSQNWIRKNVLSITDDEYEDIKQEMLEDKEIALQQQIEQQKAMIASGLVPPPEIPSTPNNGGNQ